MGLTIGRKKGQIIYLFNSDRTKYLGSIDFLSYNRVNLNLSPDILIVRGEEMNRVEREMVMKAEFKGRN